MFSQKHRLNSRCFEEVLKNGRPIYQGLFKLVFKESPDFKISIVVPKKVARLSSTRHRIKRSVTNVLKNIAKLPKSGLYIVFVQKSTKDTAEPLISTELNSLFDKIR